MSAGVSFATLAELERQGLSAALCTIVRARGSVPRHAGSKMLVHADGRVEGTVGGGELEARLIRAAREALADGRTRMVQHQLADPAAGDPGVCGGEVEVFIEPLRPAPVLLVIGAGHVGRALIHLGRFLGFRVALSDDRAELCTPEAAPGADQYLPMSIVELARVFPFHAETYIVMPTRGVSVDVAGLPHLLAAPHAYLGLIGSRRRWATARQELEARGVSRDQLDRVHAPMGLELNAETPEEIAVSVLAEIIALRRGGDGQPMRWPGAAGAAPVA